MPQVSRLTAAPAPDAPLSPREVAEMKLHLGFIREHKAVLRLSLNSHEDLMVNAQREPSDRGHCKHLLAKIDRAAVDGALAREPFKSNAAARLRFLEGAVRLTGDVGVLLAYLETVAQARSREEAALALQDAVRRIDFSALSAARLGRLLQVLVEVFSGQELTRALLGLLQLENFDTALRAALPPLPPDVIPRVAPLQAAVLAARTLRGPDVVLDGDVLVGLRTLLSLPDARLATLEEPLRRGLVELSVGPGRPADVADRAATALLHTLSAQTREHLQLAMRHAAWLMGRHQDALARKLLASALTHHKDARGPARWVAALDAPKAGRVALMETGVTGRVQPGFFLDEQRECWVRVVDVAASEQEATLHRTLALPGVAPLVTHGRDAERAVIAVSASGRPLPPGGLRERNARFSVASQMLRILRGVALAGVALPDADPARFLACLLYTSPSPRD